MANTEILAALAKVRAAKNLVGTYRYDQTIPQPVRDLLNEAYVTLDEIENKLILQDIQQWINVIKTDGDQLQTLAGQIQNTIASLKAVAQAVQDAALVVGVLAGVLAKAASSGLI